ncbi:MAG: cation:proton antiporter [Rhodothermales bacterium]
MEEPHVIIGIVIVLVLGIGSQWLAWRIKIPSILLLLIAGFVAGPVTGFLPQESLQGDWLFAFVSLAIGVILFEGGLSLRVSDLQEIGRSVVGLITLGVLVTWVLVAFAAYYVIGFGLGLSIQIGAILTVTGPTVVIPLLRHVRPSGKVGTIARWEGITIDPVGAILAVLVLEAELLLYGVAIEGLGMAILEALLGLFKVIFIGIGLSITGAGVVVVMLRRRLVPDYLLNSVALMLVIIVFELSNILQEESGLLTTTLMGIILANQRLVSVRRITEFKEDLQVLLIGSLFILLSARLDISALEYITMPAWIFLALVILIIRPLAVFISLRKSSLTTKEKAFLSWLAPRGIVAAAVASLFSFRLAEIFPDEIGGLVPIVFLVIVGTVAVYGLTLLPFARYLGLATPSAQGVLILGIHRWGLDIAMTLKELGFKVLAIDSNTRNIEVARNRGLDAERANALSEHVVDELDLGGIGKFIAWTPNDEVNTLAAIHFSEVFESADVYQLVSRADQTNKSKTDLPLHLRGMPLFDQRADFSSMSLRYSRGGKVKAIKITEEMPYEQLLESFNGNALPLFVARGSQLNVLTVSEVTQVEVDDTVILVTPAQEGNLTLMNDEEVFKHIVMEAPILDFSEVLTFQQIVKRASETLSQDLPLSAEKLATGFLEGTRYGASLLTNSVALPHITVPNIEQTKLLLVRCRKGTSLGSEDIHYEGTEISKDLAGSVSALFFLVSPEEKPRLHLRVLSQIVKTIDQDNFIAEWEDAGNVDDLRKVLLPSG